MIWKGYIFVHPHLLVAVLLMISGRSHPVQKQAVQDVNFSKEFVKKKKKKSNVFKNAVKCQKTVAPCEREA